MKCQNCGMLVDEGDSFCRNCGLSLHPGDAKAASAPPPPPHPSNLPPGYGGQTYNYGSPYQTPPAAGYGYAYPSYGYTPSRTTNTKAIISLALGASGIMVPFIGVFLGIIAIFLGFMARREIRNDPTQEGDGFAIGGIVMGGISILISLLVLILLFLPLILMGAMMHGF